MITNQGPFRLHELRRLFDSFRRDQRGSITMQVIVFSILLLGTSGIVLDSGRLYNTHTQMQAYADHMALAAANELDGQPDALARATAAVFNSNGSLPFIDAASVDGQPYSVERIVFYSQMGTPSGQPNDLTDSQNFIVAYGDQNGVQPTSTEADDAALAQFAAVIVNEREIGSVIGSIGEILVSLAEGANDAYGPNDPFNTTDATRNRNINISTVAVATLARTTCADLSTYVLCNPWEDIVLTDNDGAAVGDPLGARALDKDDPDYQNISGRALMMFAPNFKVGPLAGGGTVAITDGTDHGSLYDYDVAHQVMRLTDPISDPGGVCSLGFLLDTDGNTVASELALDYLEYRDLCLMARARAETLCFEDTIRFRPATGPMVVRASNPIFDRWPEPFRTIIENDTGGVLPNTGMTRAQFFEPDRMIANIWESSDRHGATCADETVPTYSEQDGISDWNAADLCGRSDNRFPLYETVPMPGYTWFPAAANAGVNRDACFWRTYQEKAGHPTVKGCEHDYIGDVYAGATGTKMVEQAILLRLYWRTMYRTDGALPTPANPPAEIETWYQMYQYEKSRQDELLTWDTMSDISKYSVENAQLLGLGTTDAERETKFVKESPVEYTTATGLTVQSPGYERRRIRSAMVNCKAAAEAAGNGSTEFEAPIVQIVDWYMNDAAHQFCGGPNPNCDIDDMIEAQMFIELIDTVDDAFFQRFSAYLVR